MVHLTPEQQAEVEHARGPISVVNPATGREYVLVAKDVYAKLYLVVDDGELTLDERHQLLRQGGKEVGWDDPEMDVYDELDPRESP